MNFKKIELSGFKSFADRIEVKFDTGVTAIVGPNGCGKSNVADAMRWVLGEQSSKQLRGSSMQDVIFKGTQNRKSLSFCEVSLVFDNSDHLLNVEYDEIVITRKLYRSGESEYALNRTPCRLKDIVDLLHDSGIGREGYSIIGQGKVAEIINSKPENRRAIFEEAAGIAKFKARKVETERKLERVHDELVRASDIAQVYERQLEPMRRQAENAKKYLSFKENLKGLEINAYLFNHDNASVKKEELSKRIEEIQEQITLKEEQMTACNLKYDKSMGTIQEIDKEMDALHKEIVSYSVELEKQSGQSKLVQERMNFLSMQGNKVQEEIDSLKESINQNDIILNSKQQKLQNNELKLKELFLKGEKLENEYLKVVDELTASEDDVEKNKRLIMESMDRLTEIKSNLSRLKAEKEGLKNLAFEKQKRLDELTEKSIIDNKNKEENEKETLSLLNENKNIRSDLDECNSKAIAINENRLAIFDEMQELNSSIASFESRHKLLSEMQTEYEGFAYSVKKLLMDADRNNALKSKVVGVVANLIKVPSQYQTAIETSLGNAVQNIVTLNENDAINLIDYLKQNRYGRATFLPITSMKPRNIESQFLSLMNRKGVLGIASELIEYDSKLKPIFSSLLGATVIVDNTDTAVEIAKNARYSFKIVTLDGDVINPAGSYTGGSKKAEINNILGREKEIATLATEIEKKHERMKELQQKLDECNDATDKINEKINQLEDRQHEIDITLAKQNEAQSKIMIQYRENENEIIKLRGEISGYLAKAKVIEDEINSVDELEAIVSSSKSNANLSINKNQGQYDELKQKKDKYNVDNTALKVSIATVESEISACKDDIQTIKGNLAIAEKRMSELLSELVLSQQKVEKEKEQFNKDSKGKEYFELTNKLDKCKLKLEEHDKTKTNLQVDLKLIEQERVMITGDYNRVKESKMKEEMNILKIDNDLENMAERIKEEYELDYNGCMQFKIENFDYESNLPEIIDLKKEIQKLGNVNVNAIEDSKELSERYDAMAIEIADLTQTEQNLLQIIMDLSQEMTMKFDDAFNKINENFSRSFRELFGGGSGKLILTESEDPLNAGVEIFAEPPGKKVTNLSLLSGGEQALTAIAILFAILKLRPMPFCLLDEIEAALDDANVERFAKYLHRFSEDTQFIVITHRKPTMELADNLYGVTMEEKGVSKVVSVKLSDATAMADPNSSAN